MSVIFLCNHPLKYQDVKHCLWRVRRPGKELCHVHRHRTAAVTWHVEVFLQQPYWLLPNSDHFPQYGARWLTDSKQSPLADGRGCRAYNDLWNLHATSTSESCHPCRHTWPRCLTVAGWQCSETEWHTHVTVLLKSV